LNRICLIITRRKYLHWYTLNLSPSSSPSKVAATASYINNFWDLDLKVLGSIPNMSKLSAPTLNFLSPLGFWVAKVSCEINHQEARPLRHLSHRTPKKRFVAQKWPELHITSRPNPGFHPNRWVNGNKWEDFARMRGLPWGPSIVNLNIVYSLLGAQGLGPSVGYSRNKSRSVCQKKKSYSRRLWSWLEGPGGGEWDKLSFFVDFWPIFNDFYLLKPQYLKK